MFLSLTELPLLVSQSHVRYSSKRRRVLSTDQMEDDTFREGIVWFEQNLNPADRGKKIRFIESARRVVKAFRQSPCDVGFVYISVFMFFIVSDQKAGLVN